MRLSLLHRVPGHDEGVWSCAWVPNTSGDLVTGSVDETVKLWRLTETGALTPLHTYIGHTLGVVSVVVDPSGRYAASSALDSFIRVWDLESNETKSIIETPVTESWQIAFSPTPQESGALLLAIAGGSNNHVAVWKLTDTENLQVADLPLPQKQDEAARKGQFALSVAYSHDAHQLAAGTMDGTAAIYDVETKALKKQLHGHFKPVRSLCFSPDSRMVLTASDDMHVNLYDAHNGMLVDSFSGHESWVLSVAMHPSGTCLATGSSDSRVKLWDLKTRSCVQTLTDHTDQVWSVAYNTDGSKLASVSDDKSVAVYEYT